MELISTAEKVNKDSVGNRMIEIPVVTTELWNKLEYLEHNQESFGSHVILLSASFLYRGASSTLGVMFFSTVGLMSPVSRTPAPPLELDFNASQ